MKNNSSELLSNFVGRKCNSIQKQNDRECLWQYKKPVKHGICKQDYIWNPSICTYVSQRLSNWRIFRKLRLYKKSCL